MGLILRMVFWLMGVVVLLGFGGLLFGGWLVIFKQFLWGSIGVLAGLWVLFSVKILGPAEMGVWVFLGAPIRVKDSGPCFIPWLLASLKRYPKKMYNFVYPAREVVSAAGEYEKPEEKEEEKEEEKKKKKKYYGAQVLKVSSVIYLNFPRPEKEKVEEEKVEEEKVEEEKTHPLIKILRADIPIEDEPLKNWTEDAVVSAIRAVIGTMTWKRAIDDMKGVNDKVEDILKDREGPLGKAGFRKEGIRFVITEIKLPEGLTKAFPQVDVQRLEAEAAVFEAEERAIETIGTVIRMMAESRKKSVEEIRELIETTPDLQREFLELSKDLITREMAIKGQSYLDIRVQGAEGFERVILNALAAWQRMPMGGEGPKETKAKRERRKEGEKEGKDFLQEMGPEGRKKHFGSIK